MGTAREYTGEIDFTSNSVTTPYELLLSNTKPVDGIACVQSSAVDLEFSLFGSEPDCSDAPTDADWEIQLSGLGVFAFDKFPVGSHICVRTKTGTASTGSVKCLTWKDGAPQ